MPPTRSSALQWQAGNNPLANGIATRAKRTTLGAPSENQPAGKRKAESPLKKATKRSAFGDITNVSYVGVIIGVLFV